MFSQTLCIDLQTAADQLGISVGTLKTICHAGGIKRWPFRKRSGIQRLLKKSLAAGKEAKYEAQPSLPPTYKLA